MITYVPMSVFEEDNVEDWASDARADVQSAIDILDSLRLAGKLSQDHFQDVCYFLQSAQEHMMEGQTK